MSGEQESLRTSNQCSVCGKPATGAVLKDLFGKSDVMEPRCPDHGMRLRDAQDLAEIDRLTRELAESRQMHKDWFEGPNGVRWYMAQNDRLRAALKDERLKVVQNYSSSIRTIDAALNGEPPYAHETFGSWQPMETADVSKLYSSATWVLLQTDTGEVREATPFYFSGGGYMWLTARGENLRGCDAEHDAMLRTKPLYWQPLPEPRQSSEKA